MSNSNKFVGTKGRILLTVILGLLFLLFLMLTNIGIYTVEQEYSYVATNQVEDSDAPYQLMQSKSAVLAGFMAARVVGLLTFAYLLYRIWRKNKSN